MADKYTFHQENFVIRANEIDASGKITLSAIGNFFQEVAGNNARDLNFDITDLHKTKSTWVLYRMDIKIDEYPNWRDEITLETWPASGDSFRALRNYQIIDKNGKKLGCCLSYWLMIDLVNRKPMRLPQTVLDTRFVDREHSLELKSNRFRPLEERTVIDEFKVRRSDLDMNNHVNNVNYITWMLECIPEDKLTDVHRFDIIYMNEGVLGDTIQVYTKIENELPIMIELTKNESHTLAIAEISYRTA